MTAAPQFRCWMGSGDPSESTDDTNWHLLFQNPKKKTSFLFNPDVVEKIPKPAHLIIEYRSAISRSIPFLLGGFQIICNAKSVEVYLTEEKSGKEEYLMTSKGILFEKGDTGEEWLKAGSVVPGGPRAVTRLHVKLVSLQPRGETSALVASLKVTARLPKVESLSDEASESAASAASDPSAHVVQNTKAANGGSDSAAITQADLGAVMASMSMMARTTEEDITKAMAAQFTKLENQLESRWTKMEHHVYSLTQVVISQKTFLEEEKKLIEQQQDMIKSQAGQMDLLLKQQQELTASQTGQMDLLLKQQQELTETVKSLQLELKRGTKYKTSPVGQNEQSMQGNKSWTELIEAIEKDPKEGEGQTSGKEGGDENEAENEEQHIEKVDKEDHQGETSDSGPTEKAESDLQGGTRHPGQGQASEEEGREETGKQHTPKTPKEVIYVENIEVTLLEDGMEDPREQDKEKGVGSDHDQSNSKKTEESGQKDNSETREHGKSNEEKEANDQIVDGATESAPAEKEPALIEFEHDELGGKETSDVIEGNQSHSKKTEESGQKDNSELCEHGKSNEEKEANDQIVDGATESAPAEKEPALIEFEHDETLGGKETSDVFEGNGGEENQHKLPEVAEGDLLGS